MKKILFFILSVVISLGAVSCTEKPDNGNFDVQFSVPAEATVNYADTEMSFRVQFGKAPLMTDVIVFGDPTGELKTCKITSVTEKNFTIALYKGIVSGLYNVYIQRGNSKKLMGTMDLTVSYTTPPAEDDKEIVVKEGNNVYGVVSCDGKGVAGVVVSDGYEVVQTDSDGVYQFKSDKYHGYVFISVPSGYEAVSEGVFPMIHQQLAKSKDQVERVDFPLVQAPGQENHTMLIFGDMHMANRTSDARQFSDFTADVNEYLASYAGRKTYAMTMGDMTWELYWVSNK